MGIHDGTPDLYAACLAATEVTDKRNYPVARIEKPLGLGSNFFQDRQKLLCHPSVLLRPGRDRFRPPGSREVLTPPITAAILWGAMSCASAEV